MIKLTDLIEEMISNTKIICDKCGWSWKIKDGGDDLFICHKCEHDNTPKKQNNLIEKLKQAKLIVEIM